MKLSTINDDGWTDNTITYSHDNFKITSRP